MLYRTPFKAMREAYFEKLKDQSSETKAGEKDGTVTAKPDDATDPLSPKAEAKEDKSLLKAKSKPKPKLKKKAKDDDMFVSDNEDDVPAEPSSIKKSVVKKAGSDEDQLADEPIEDAKKDSKAKPAILKPKVEGEEEEKRSEKPQSKTKKPASKAKMSSRLKRSPNEDEDEEDDDVVRPSKRGRAK